MLIAKGAFVWLTGRTKERMDRSIEKLKADFPMGKFDAFLMDYNDLTTIKPAMEAFLTKIDRLDGVLHNAGVTGVGTTVQGYDMCLGINAIAPFLVQKFIDDILIRTAEVVPENSVRIVWVSSSLTYMAPSKGGIHWDDINNPRAQIIKIGPYAQSKAVTIYEAALWPEKTGAGSKVISVSSHPGPNQSDIGRNYDAETFPLSVINSQPTEFGAHADLWPLLHPSVTLADNGAFYVPFGIKTEPREDIVNGYKGPDGQKLWSWLEQQVKAYL